MLAFVTTLRHPLNSNDYDRVEALLSDTLASLYRQTSEDHVILVVGNQRPPYALSDRAQFVQVDFRPPTDKRGAETGMSAFLWDKGTKVGVGLAAARDMGADHVMFFDADDFVHRDIARYVSGHPDSPGWIVKRGYIYSRSRNAYALRRRLFRICGTSFVLPLSAYGVPDDLTVSSSQDDVARAFGRDALEHVIGDHRYALEWWAERGRRLESLPFAGAVYQVDTGENHSGSRLLGPGLPHAPFLWDDFGVQPSPRGALSSWWAAAGPPAWKPDLRPRRPFFLKPTASQLLEQFPAQNG